MTYRCFLCIIYHKESYQIYRDIEIPIHPFIGMSLINLKQQPEDSEHTIKGMEYNIISQQIHLLLGTDIFKPGWDFNVSEINLYYSQWKFPDGQDFKIEETDP